MGICAEFQDPSGILYKASNQSSKTQKLSVFFLVNSGGSVDQAKIPRQLGVCAVGETILGSADKGPKL